MDDLNSTLNRVLMADTDEKANTAEAIRHGFSINAWNFLLQADTHCEVATQQSICPIPGCSSWFSGFINHRGNVVPIYDLGVFLEPEAVKARSKGNTWFLLLGSHPDTAGFIIDQLPSILVDPSMSSEENPEVTPTALKDFIISTWNHNNRIWLEIDHKALLEHFKAHTLFNKQQ